MFSNKLVEFDHATLSASRCLLLWQRANGLNRDWLRLEIDGFDAPPQSELQLLVTGDDENLSTFDLPIAPDNSIDVTLNIAGLTPVRVELRCDCPANTIQIDRLSLKSGRASQVFINAFRSAPGPMLAVARNWMRRRKVRARNGFHAIVSAVPAIHYDRWLQQHEQALRNELTTDADIARATESIVTVQQRENGWQLLRADEKDYIRTTSEEPSLELKRLLQSVNADWIWLVDSSDQVSAGAALLLGNAILRSPHATVIYGDHDAIESDGRRLNPHFCPDWNATLYWSQPYFRSFAVKLTTLTETLERVGDVSASDEIMLALSAHIPGDDIVHVPRMLTHRQPFQPLSETHQVDRDRWRAAVARHIGTDQAEVSLASRGSCHIRWRTPDPSPRVSLIVPTRDRMDLLRPCIESLLSATRYPNLEVIIADNGSSEPETLSYFQQLGALPNVQIVDCNGPFNFAAINNQAAQMATGTILGFINNDIEAKDSGWLQEMVGWASRPNIGAVGARLLYPNGLVQHAGVVMGIRGSAGHIHRFLDPNHPGYMNRLQRPQEFSAVTAACMLVEHAKFEQVDGFDETHFPINFNDVDLCLRLNDAGYKTVWTPYAELWHKETASRPRAFTPERLALFQRESAALNERWGEVLNNDPHYNSNLTRLAEDATLALPREFK